MASVFHFYCMLGLLTITLIGWLIAFIQSVDFNDHLWIEIEFESFWQCNAECSASCLGKTWNIFCDFGKADKCCFSSINLTYNGGWIILLQTFKDHVKIQSECSAISFLSPPSTGASGTDEQMLPCHWLLVIGNCLFSPNDPSLSDQLTLPPGWNSFVSD